MKENQRYILFLSILLLGLTLFFYFNKDEDSEIQNNIATDVDIIKTFKKDFAGGDAEGKVKFLNNLIDQVQVEIGNIENMKSELLSGSDLLIKEKNRLACIARPNQFQKNRLQNLKGQIGYIRLKAEEMDGYKMRLNNKLVNLKKLKNKLARG